MIGCMIYFVITEATFSAGWKKKADRALNWSVVCFSYSIRGRLDAFVTTTINFTETNKKGLPRRATRPPRWKGHGKSLIY
jgi:hypothetical protein